jgi:hypothetical protein
MNLRRKYPLLAAVAVLGAAAYVAIAHTTAPPDCPVNSATADGAVNL